MSDYLPPDYNFVPFSSDLARWLQEANRRAAVKRQRELDEFLARHGETCRLCGLDFAPCDLVDGVCEAHR